MRRVATLLLLLSGCGGPTAEPRTLQDRDLPGLSVLEVLSRLNLHVDPQDVLEEPPGIGRGLKAADPTGDLIWIYVDRFPLRNVPTREAQVEVLRPMKVIGVARLKDARWEVTGKVVPHWHQN